MIKIFEINLDLLNVDVYERLIEFLKFNEFIYIKSENAIEIDVENKGQSFRVNNYLKCKNIKFYVKKLIEVY